jgi:hypothetical protein
MKIVPMKYVSIMTERGWVVNGCYKIGENGPFQEKEHQLVHEPNPPKPIETWVFFHCSPFV